MIRAFYGLERNPFSCEGCTLLPQQQEAYETLRVHSQQGGLCLVLGVPGTGKTMIRDEILRQADEKRMLVVTVARTLHTYTNTLKILCDAFKASYDGGHFKCERELIKLAHGLKVDGKSLIIVIDEAHLLEMQTLRKLRLLFEEFPKNHNLILIGQPELMGTLGLSVNQDIRSRVTYSVVMKRLTPEDTESFLLAELDRSGLGHNTFTADALGLIARSSEGVLRKARNLGLSCLLEAVRAQTRTVDIDTVNHVLIQPHWRNEQHFLIESIAKEGGS